MPKYYIQSEDVSWIVIAQDAEGAALWTLNQTLQSYLDRDAVSNTAASSKEQLFRILEGLAQFASEIQVSQVGWGASDTESFDTGEIFNTWRRLSSSLDHLFDSFN